ncbi:hypothetical protein SGLAM104S_03290 [Streptomyces glaucescens]
MEGVGAISGTETGVVPEGCPPFPSRKLRCTRSQDRSRCVHEHDGGDRAARGHGGYGGGAVSARLRGIARETEQIVAAGAYRAPDGREVYLADVVEAARAGTRIHGPNQVRRRPRRARTP